MDWCLLPWLPEKRQGACFTPLEGMPHMSRCSMKSGRVASVAVPLGHACSPCSGVRAKTRAGGGDVYIYAPDPVSSCSDIQSGEKNWCFACGVAQYCKLHTACWIAMMAEQEEPSGLRELILQLALIAFVPSTPHHPPLNHPPPPPQRSFPSHLPCVHYGVYGGSPPGPVLPPPGVGGDGAADLCGRARGRRPPCCGPHCGCQPRGVDRRPCTDGHGIGPARPP